MQWRTHVFAGIGSLWLLELLPPGLDNDVLPLCIGLAAFGALLPDLDANESKVKHLSVAGVQPFALPAQAISRGFGHRGFLHSLSAVLLVAVLSLPLAIQLGWQPWAALALGYTSHLVADGCTRSGVPFLYIPLLNRDKRRYHLLPRQLRFVTGSEAEHALFPLLALLVFVLLLRHLSAGSTLLTDAVIPLQSRTITIV